MNLLDLLDYTLPIYYRGKILGKTPASLSMLTKMEGWVLLYIESEESE